MSKIIFGLLIIFVSCSVSKSINSFATRHNFDAEFTGITYHICKGKTMLCPKECESSGEYANFKIIRYHSKKGEGKAGRERLKTFSIRMTNYHKKPLNIKHLNILKSLKKKDEVNLIVDFIYDDSKSFVQTERNILNIKKI